MQFELVTYQEHALEKAPAQEPLPIIGIRSQTEHWQGGGIDADIISATVTLVTTLIIDKQRNIIRKTKDESVQNS